MSMSYMQMPDWRRCLPPVRAKLARLLSSLDLQYSNHWELLAARYRTLAGGDSRTAPARSPATAFSINLPKK